MANPGTVNVDLQLTGSAIRLRALQLAIGTLNHDLNLGKTATNGAILERAEAFEQYVERGKPEEAAAVSEKKSFGMPTPWILGVEERLQGAIISPVDADYLINAVRARTRS